MANIVKVFLIVAVPVGSYSSAPIHEEQEKGMRAKNSRKRSAVSHQLSAKTKRYRRPTTYTGGESKGVVLIDLIWLTAER